MENYKIIAVGLILVVMVTNISVIYSNEVDNLELAESAPGFQQGFGGYVRQRMLASRKSGLRLCLQERRMRKTDPYLFRITLFSGNAIVLQLRGHAIYRLKTS